MNDPQDPHRTAAALLPLLGGAANIASLAHCMTRLRPVVHDPALVRADELRALPGVLGVVDGGGAYQVVLGPGTAARTAAALDRLVADARTATEERPEPGPAQGSPPGGRTLRRIAQVFVPLIPALVGCGLVAALAGTLGNLGWAPSLAPALTAVSSGFMSLIAVFVGWQTAREFGGTPVLGGAVAAVIVCPAVARAHPFGTTLAPGQGGVLGALAAALLAVWVERACRRLVPRALDALLTPALTVLLPGLATVYGLMYAAGELSLALGHFTDRLLSGGGAAAGFVLGGLFLPMVMLGLHQALIPVHATLIAQQGQTTLLPLLAMAGAGQVGAALAVYLRLARDHPEIRRTVRSALPAGLMGIGEPLVYGVSLPLGRPFVTACVGGAFGGGFLGLLGQWGEPIGARAIGPSGWALFPLLSGGGQGPAQAMAVYGAGLLVGYAAGFAATYAFGCRGVQGAPYRAPETPEGGTP
ncbi:PTS transporter subunit EIIC [Streptomyces sp. NPDC052396]|uniref:PTS transporter subunit EIIC n=1 Tax=Streptomyces sp. NPDC052396 TaxID=3365689 RepID=UPI0037D4EC43